MLLQQTWPIPSSRSPFLQQYCSYSIQGITGFICSRAGQAGLLQEGALHSLCGLQTAALACATARQLQGACSSQSSLCWVILALIFPDFPLNLIGFFPGKHLIQFLANKMQKFWNFVLHNCISFLLLSHWHQTSRIRKLKQTLNPKPWKKIDLPKTLNPKP